MTDFYLDYDLFPALNKPIYIHLEMELIDSR